MASRKPAAKASTSTALTLWEQEMADAAVAQAAVEKPSGFTSSISIRGGVMMIDKNKVKDNELDVVILASVHENQWYTSKFDPDSIQTPDCYAIGKEEEGMAPHADSADKQGDEEGMCANCEHNKMGSADTGRGKACKNVRRIAVVAADALESLEKFEQAEVRTMKIPVTSVRNYAKYVRGKLADEIKRPVYGVVTTIKVEPHQKYQFETQFSFAELVQFDQALYEAMKKKAAEVEKTLLESSYPKFVEEQVVQMPTNGKRAKYQQKAEAPAEPPARKTAARRRAA
jgi:hypothetical protein